jgi:hypothetical protein
VPGATIDAILMGAAPRTEAEAKAEQILKERVEKAVGDLSDLNATADQIVEAGGDATAVINEVAANSAAVIGKAATTIDGTRRQELLQGGAPKTLAEKMFVEGIENILKALVTALQQIATQQGRQDIANAIEVAEEKDEQANGTFRG